MKRLLIIILLLLSVNVFSQNIEFGLRSEFNFVSNNQGHSGISPMNLFIGLRIVFSDFIILKANTGFSYPNDGYGGFNSSVVLEKDIFNKLSVISGINFLKSLGLAHGQSIFDESYSKSFNHFIIGCGYHLTESSSLDLLLFLPLNDKYGFTFDTETNTLDDKITNCLIKFGYEYYF